MALETLVNPGDEGIKVLAPDLEGTLISDAESRICRPGLFGFLAAVFGLFDRVVIRL